MVEAAFDAKAEESGVFPLERDCGYIREALARLAPGLIRFFAFQHVPALRKRLEELPIA